MISNNRNIVAVNITIIATVATETTLTIILFKSLKINSKEKFNPQVINIPSSGKIMAFLFAKWEEGLAKL